MDKYMDKHIFQLNQKIEINERESDYQDGRRFNSRIEAVETGTLVIAVPYGDGRFMAPESGRRFDGRVTTGNCAYCFESNLIDVIEDLVPLWRIAWPADIVKIQMRSFVRLNVHLGIQVEVGDRTSVKALTKDISGGGVQFLLPRPLSIGAGTKIMLPLSEKTTVEAKGEVVRIVPPLMESDHYGIGMKFTAIDERSRDGIIKYIFRQQVQRRMQGLEQTTG
ncbi:MAG: PilZ domain-containing protein [Negativicutes bacterium]|nr:PilZ domain-containing protein [Negativicutes bacterium]